MAPQLQRFMSLLDLNHVCFSITAYKYLTFQILFGFYNLLVLSSKLNFWHMLILYWRRQRHPTPVLLPAESHGWRSLVGCSPWGREESDTTDRLPFHLSLSCIGEGNGNPLQCSCLENPRDGGAWWAVVYGVAQSPTRLKWLSSSSTLYDKDTFFQTYNFKLEFLFLYIKCVCTIGIPSQSSPTIFKSYEDHLLIEDHLLSLHDVSNNTFRIWVPSDE